MLVKTLHSTFHTGHIRRPRVICKQPSIMASAAVQEYIEKHGLQKKVEDVLNLCVKEKADEPLSFMVRCRADRSHSACGVR